MGYLNLSGEDWKRITRALESAFTVLQLDRWIDQQFPRVHREARWMLGHADVVYDVADKANRLGLLDAVLAAAVAERPGRPDLRTLTLYYAQQSGWTAPVEPTGLDAGLALELLTIRGDPFLDTSALARWLIRVERQVCQVRCGEASGSGFLVAPDLVLTCHHVVEGYLTQAVPATAVAARFDYRRAPGGAEPSETLPWVGIDPAWTTPKAPDSAADTVQGVRLGRTPADHELDFALLKLAQPIGSQPPPGEGAPRGWIDLSQAPPLPAEQTPALIVQHPERTPSPPPQQPLQITFATPGFERSNANRTRIAYTPGTLRGSSGSPVFDSTLRAVALHHNRGQSNPEAAELVRNNRGIPLATIWAALSAEVRQRLIPPPATEA